MATKKPNILILWGDDIGFTAQQHRRRNALNGATRDVC
jgi:hypothetical protein